MKRAAKNKQQVRSLTLAIGFSTILFVLSAIPAASRTVTGAELSVFWTINNWPDWLHWIFIPITQFGSAWIVFTATLYTLYKHRNFLAVRVFVVGGITYLLSEFFKHIFLRLRPDLILPNVHVRELALGAYGFPSGHTAVSTAVSLVLIGIINKHRLWIAAVWIILVGLSRVYLGMHAPLDIIGGAMLGIIVVSVEQLLRKAEKPFEKYV